ncbi:MAG: winged helix-turn-helix transcriptional regulator [Thermoplasmata archaeon]|nr:winged helix-turn-helix transcriptional regulator [Thermoplasmata archaeon]
MVEDPLALVTRRRLYDTVVGTPGLSAREIQRATGTAWGETTYHLLRLEEAGHVHREHGTHQDFYFAEGVPLGDRTLLRSSTVRRILVVLLEEPDRTLEEIAERSRTSLSRSSIHVRRLVETGLVETGVRERWRTFRIGDRRRIAQVLVGQRGGYGDEYIDRLVDVFAEMFPP